MQLQALKYERVEFLSCRDLYWGIFWFITFKTWLQDYSDYTFQCLDEAKSKSEWNEHHALFNKGEVRAIAEALEN